MAGLPITTANDAITASINTTTLVANLRTATLAGAQDVPLIARSVATLDPELQAQIEGKSALGSKTLWAGVVTHAVIWAVGYFGLNWDSATTEMVAGVLSWLILLGLRFVTKQPITSFLPKAPPAV